MSYTNRKKIKEFWNSTKSVLAGQKDKQLKFREQYILNKKINSKVNILDLGCGTGELIKYLDNNNKIKTATGVDFSKKHILEAKKIKKKYINFYCDDVIPFLNKKKIKNKKFDIIITKRLLINLDSETSQIKFINKISKFLKPNGVYIALESSLFYYANINKLRKKIHLPLMKPMWHNVYINDKKIRRTSFKNLKLVKIEELFSTYYFFSRVINALFCSFLGLEPKYDDLINRIGWSLPQNLLKSYSRERIYFFKKK